MSLGIEWLYAFAILGGLIAAWRIWQNLQKLRQRQNDSWDARLIDQLRKRGSDPFKPHDVDFFFALPNELACRAVHAQLETEGYAVDIKAVPESPDFVFSLHARKSMRLSVPDMQDISRRFSTLATANGGRYDGWAADVVKTA